MTEGPLAGVPGVVGRHLMLRLRASSVVLDHHHGHEHEAEHLDDVAAGEFVDDLIREGE